MKRIDLMRTQGLGLESSNISDRYSDYVSPEIRIMEPPLNNFLYNEFQKKFPAMQSTLRKAQIDNSITGFEKSIEFSSA